MLRVLKQAFLAKNGSEVFFECRRCGTNVSSVSDQCPECGSPDIARFEI